MAKFPELLSSGFIEEERSGIVKVYYDKFPELLSSGFIEEPSTRIWPYPYWFPELLSSGFIEDYH